eukprot:1629473-Heterocapsa_arctica.AAC.1
MALHPPSPHAMSETLAEARTHAPSCVVRSSDQWLHAWYSPVRWMMQGMASKLASAGLSLS